MARPLLVWMAAVMRDSWIRAYKFPENISRDIPNWGFPDGTGSPARHQSRPDALFVRPVPGRQDHLDPSKIPPQDRDIHLVELKFCADTNPFIAFGRAATQHSHTRTRIKTRSSRNDKVTLHIILIGVVNFGCEGGILCVVVICYGLCALM
eukprot:1158799-Pelagomonas_calceolata.AAC.2